MLLLPTKVKRLSLVAREHRWRPCHDGARPCSGLAGLAWVVAPSTEHLRVMEKRGHVRGNTEVCGAVLATVNLTTAELR
jgi:hypothetical protein